MMKLSWRKNHPIPDQETKKRLLTMTKHGLLTDMALFSAKKMYHCHKVIVTEASPLVHALIKLQTDPSKQFVVSVGDYLKKDIEVLLEYMYLGTVIVSNQELQGIKSLLEKLLISFSATSVAILPTCPQPAIVARLNPGGLLRRKLKDRNAKVELSLESITGSDSNHQKTIIPNDHPVAPSNAFVFPKKALLQLTNGPTAPNDERLKDYVKSKDDGKLDKSNNETEPEPVPNDREKHQVRNYNEHSCSQEIAKEDKVIAKKVREKRTKLRKSLKVGCPSRHLGQIPGSARLRKKKILKEKLKRSTKRNPNTITKPKSQKARRTQLSRKNKETETCLKDKNDDHVWMRYQPVTEMEAAAEAINAAIAIPAPLETQKLKALLKPGKKQPDIPKRRLFHDKTETNIRKKPVVDTKKGACKKRKNQLNDRDKEGEGSSESGEVSSPRKRSKTDMIEGKCVKVDKNLEKLSTAPIPRVEIPPNNKLQQIPKMHSKVPDKQTLRKALEKPFQLPCNGYNIYNDDAFQGDDRLSVILSGQPVQSVCCTPFPNQLSFRSSTVTKRRNIRKPKANKANLKKKKDEALKGIFIDANDKKLTTNANAPKNLREKVPVAKKEKAKGKIAQKIEPEVEPHTRQLRPRTLKAS